jgi:hypothetical protein
MPGGGNNKPRRRPVVRGGRNDKPTGTPNVPTARPIRTTRRNGRKNSTERRNRCGTRNHSCTYPHMLMETTTCRGQRDTLSTSCGFVVSFFDHALDTIPKPDSLAVDSEGVIVVWVTTSGGGRVQGVRRSHIGSENEGVSFLRGGIPGNGLERRHHRQWHIKFLIESPGSRMRGPSWLRRRPSPA